jgi:citronellyl-CoA synthetase
MSLIKSVSEVAGMVKDVYMLATIKPRPIDSLYSIGLAVRERAQEQPDDLFCTFEGKSITWKEFEEQSNQVAHFLKEEGIKSGDSIAFLMDNRLENLIISLGILKLGAICSFINTSLTGKPLIHCVELVESKKIIFGAELSESVAEIREQLNFSKDNFLFVADNYEGRPRKECPEWAKNFDDSIKDFDTQALKETEEIVLKQRAYYIFTSGTTGLPKASIITHDRWLRMAMAFSLGAYKLEPHDHIYVCLPLYHSNAQFIGYGSALHVGASMHLRRKFSASSWLKDVRENNCTAFTYIGEVCRYLMDTPEKPDDANNPMIKVVGNGLRPDIWMEFKQRFGIERIGEFYGASEGNAGCVNLFNKDKTIGLCAAKHALINYDVIEDKIIRNEQGLCTKVKKGDPGLMITEVSDKWRYDGYSSKEASDKKILKNVFKEGDQFFNTGDILKQVDVGFTLGLPHYDFVDRVGDTFRWKGENVSTNEIGELLSEHSDVVLANVYGVEIPGTNGRAGMAALTLKDNDNFNLVSFSKLVKDKIPSYAQPLFLRIHPEMETTGTHKMKKGELREEAYHLDKVAGDTIYVLKPSEKEYTLLDESFYKEISEGASGY